jgi:hypothetical protein
MHTHTSICIHKHLYKMHSYKFSLRASWKVSCENMPCVFPLSYVSKTDVFWHMLQKLCTVRAAKWILTFLFPLLVYLAKFAFGCTCRMFIWLLGSRSQDSSTGHSALYVANDTNWPHTNHLFVCQVRKQQQHLIYDSFVLCHIYRQAVGKRKVRVANICTRAPFQRRGKYAQVTNICQV